MYINCNENATPETNMTRVNRIMLNEENSDDLTEPGELLKAYTEGTTTTSIWNIKQYSIDEFYGCALFVGAANITNLDKESIFTSDVNSYNKCYILAYNDKTQFSEHNLDTSNNFKLECVSGTSNTATIFDILNACLHIKNTTLKDLLTQTQMSLFKKSGYISPYINIGSLNYLLVESNDFDLNDFGWDAMY